tara:strand:+ start:599 stop:796 length:198 start_codon:yes stop_codon:yes gene_type:complete
MKYEKFKKKYVKVLKKLINEPLNDPNGMRFEYIDELIHLDLKYPDHCEKFELENLKSSIKKLILV